MNEKCDICGAPAQIADGIVGAYLCTSTDCLDAAWDRAFFPHTTVKRWGGVS